MIQERPTAPRRNERPSPGWTIYRLTRDNGWGGQSNPQKHQTVAANLDAQALANARLVVEALKTSLTQSPDPETMDQALADPRYDATDENIAKSLE